MADIKTAYGTSNQAVTITLDSLVSSATAGQASTAVDETTNKPLDELVVIKVVYPNSVPANDKAIYFYVYGTVDGGTSYTDGVTGTDAAFSASDWGNMILLGRPLIAVQNKTLIAGPFSVAAAFGGSLPDHWGIAVRNYSGQTLGTGCTVKRQAVYATSI